MNFFGGYDDIESRYIALLQELTAWEDRREALLVEIQNFERQLQEPDQNADSLAGRQSRIHERHTSVEQIDARLSTLRSAIAELCAENPVLPSPFLADSLQLKLLRERLRAIHEEAGRLHALWARSEITSKPRERRLEELVDEIERLGQRIRQLERASQECG